MSAPLTSLPLQIFADYLTYDNRVEAVIVEETRTLPSPNVGSRRRKRSKAPLCKLRGQVVRRNKTIKGVKESMISKLGQVMLYVNNQDEAVKFWTEKLGFSVIAEEKNGEMKWIEIAPKGAETSIVLHNKEFVAKMEPELNLGAPSLMFFSENFDQLYDDLSNKNVKVGEIVNVPSGRVFNFADNEENYFAVMERK